MRTKKTPQPSVIHNNNMLISNFKTISAMSSATVDNEVITALFNSTVFKNKRIDQAGMETLIEYASQLKQSCVPTKQVKVILSVVKELRNNKK